MPQSDLAHPATSNADTTSTGAGSPSSSATGGSVSADPVLDAWRAELKPREVKTSDTDDTASAAGDGDGGQSGSGQRGSASSSDSDKAPKGKDATAQGAKAEKGEQDPKAKATPKGEPSNTELQHTAEINAARRVLKFHDPKITDEQIKAMPETLLLSVSKQLRTLQSAADKAKAQKAAPATSPRKNAAGKDAAAGNSGSPSRPNSSTEATRRDAEDGADALLDDLTGLGEDNATDPDAQDPQPEADPAPEEPAKGYPKDVVNAAKALGCRPHEVAHWNQLAEAAIANLATTFPDIKSEGGRAKLMQQAKRQLDAGDQPRLTYQDILDFIQDAASAVLTPASEADRTAPTAAEARKQALSEQPDAGTAEPRGPGGDSGDPVTDAWRAAHQAAREATSDEDFQRRLRARRLKQT